jgi:adenylylsulfate kinase-like enzyme
VVGEIPNFTGVGNPYEPPVNPEIVVNSAEQTEQESRQAILEALDKANLIYRKASSTPYRGKLRKL